jgi:putative ABC transport system ATP-binding protein
MVSSSELDCAIRVRDLHKSFREAGQAHHVLRGVDLDIRRGELVALVGRSGSGKSTLLNLLAGLEVPDRGTIEVGGVDLGALGDTRRTVFRRDSIGIVFQFFNLIPVLTALDNVALPGFLAGRPRQGVEERARDLLARVGMADRAGAFPDQLSGGEQQRVATARALINGPAVILADEPTGNLDSENADRTLELLQGLATEDGHTILIATHDATVARRASRIVGLVDGVVEELPAERAPHPAAERL